MPSRKMTKKAISWTYPGSRRLPRAVVPLERDDYDQAAGRTASWARRLVEADEIGTPSCLALLARIPARRILGWLGPDKVRF
jgi:hypothetical protein